jgi:hypothetical protein
MFRLLCSAILSLLLLAPADAGPRRGIVAISTAPGATGAALIGMGDVQGPSYAFLNWMNGGGGFFQQTFDFSANLDANQYPNIGSLPSDLSMFVSTPTADSGYAGSMVARWKATGAININAGVTSLAVTSGGVSCPSCIKVNTGSSTTISGIDIRATFTFTTAHISVNVTYPAVATGIAYSGMNSLVLCKAADEARIDAGQIYNPDFLSVLTTLQPKTLRTMDWSNTNISNLSQYRYRTTTSAINWVGDQWNPNVHTTFTHSNPTATTDLYAGTTFTDAPATWPAVMSNSTVVVQGFIPAANTTWFPTISISTISSGAPKDIVSFDGYLPSMTVGGSTFSTGDTFNIAFTYGGGSTYAFSYVTVAADNTTTKIANKIIAAINADATLAANNITADAINNLTNSSTANVQVYSKLSGTSYVPSVSVGTETFALSNALGKNLGPGSIAANRSVTLVYHAVLDKFVYTPSGIIYNVPLEAQARLANDVNANLWYNFQILMDDATATSVATNIRDHLNTGLTGYFEFSNEIWNFNSLTDLATALGQALGFPNSSGQTYHSWYSARFRKMMANAYTAWTATRSGSTIRRALMGQISVGTTAGMQLYRMNGNDLVGATYPNYCVFLGLTWSGGTCSGDPGYNAFPNRAIDVADAIGYAPYYVGAVLNKVYPTGATAGEIAGMTTAAAAYAAGNTAASKAWVDSDIRAGTLNGVVPNNVLAGMFAPSSSIGTGGYYQNWELIAAAYTTPGVTRPNGMADLTIEDYEGALESIPPTASQCNSMSISSTNLTSISNASPAVFSLTSHGLSIGNPILLGATSSLPSGLSTTTVYYAISAGFTANQFEVSTTPGGSAVNTSSAGSGTFSFNNTCANITLMLTDYKFSSLANTMVQDQFKQMMGTYPNGPQGSLTPNYTLNGALPHSKTPAWFSLQGPNGPWSLLPGSIYVTPYYQTYYGNAAYN